MPTARAKGRGRTPIAFTTHQTSAYSSRKRIRRKRDGTTTVRFFRQQVKALPTQYFVCLRVPGGLLSRESGKGKHEGHKGCTKEADTALSCDSPLTLFIRRFLRPLRQSVQERIRPLRCFDLAGEGCPERHHPAVEFAGRVFVLLDHRASQANACKCTPRS